MGYPLSDSQGTLTFEDGKVTLTAGCQVYQGQYEFNGSNLSIESLQKLPQSCSELPGDGEYLFLRTMARASNTVLNQSNQSLALMSYWVREVPQASQDGPVRVVTQQSANGILIFQLQQASP